MLIKLLGMEAELIRREGFYLRVGSWEAWVEACGYSKEQGHKIIQFKDETPRWNNIPLKACETWKFFIYRLSITIDHSIPSNQKERIEKHLSN